MKTTDESKFCVLEMAVLKQIFRVSLMDRWINDDIRAHLEFDFHIVEAIRRRSLSYFIQVCRMKQDRIPVRVLHEQIHGSKPRDRPSNGLTC